MNALVCSANSFTICYSSSYLPTAANESEVLHIHRKSRTSTFQNKVDMKEQFWFWLYFPTSVGLNNWCYCLDDMSKKRSFFNKYLATDKFLKCEMQINKFLRIQFIAHMR